MDLTVKFLSKAKVKKLASVFDNFEAIVLKAITKGGIEYENLLKKNLTSGVFNIKTDTGRLRNSFTQIARKTASGASVKVGTNLVYARIQEKGGRINITSKMSRFAWYKYSDSKDPMWKAIALKKGGQIRIPPHHYMENTLNDSKSHITRIVNREIINELIRQL